MTAMDTIETKTKRFADARDALCAIVTELQEALEHEKRIRLAKIRVKVVVATEEKNILEAALKESPGLFVKPRTVVFHGIKVGFQKGKGALQFDNEESVISRIRKIYGDDSPLLSIKRSVNKVALNELDAAELKRLGCTIADADDQVVIKPTGGDVEKVVNALLKGAEEEAQSPETIQ